MKIFNAVALDQYIITYRRALTSLATPAIILLDEQLIHDGYVPLL
jgi:hypothetical protein